MRILWHSNAPWSPTGYGVQTRHFTNRIRNLGHEVAISAFYGLESGVLAVPGTNIPVFPKGQSPYGQDSIIQHARNWGADIAISLVDAWVFDPDEIAHNGVRWVPWFPVDSEPLPRKVFERVLGAYERLVFSKFAQNEVEAAGLDCHYIPHGIDTNVLRPGDKRRARETLGLPQDRYIVGVIAANKGFPPRKSWPEIFIAFKEFKRKHPDALLYVQTTPDARYGGVDMLEHLNSLALTSNDVRINDPYFANMGAGDEQMAAAYNALDVLLSPSRGEGFGIPIVEAQSCGVPVIVGDWTAMSELCFSGWKIPKSSAQPEWTQLGAYMFVPHAGAIVDALEQAYKLSGNSDYAKRARKGAQAYDVDKVTEKYWKPVLAEIAAQIEAEKVPA